MADITLNSAVRSNLRTLQSTTDLLNRTEERLSTGKKVNSALDNPSSFFTAQALDRRASDFNGLLDTVSSSVQTLEAADNGIKAITDLVEQLKATVRSARQSASAVDEAAAFTSSAISGATAANLVGPGVQTKVGTVVLNDNTGTAVNITGATKLSGTAGAASNNLAAASKFVNGDTLTVAGETIRFYTDAAARTADAVNAGDTQLLITDDVDAVLTAIEGALGAGSDASVVAGRVTVKAAEGAAAFTFGGTGATKLALGTTASDAVSDLTGKTLTVQVGEGDVTSVTFGAGSGQVNTIEALNTALADAGAKASLSSDGKLKIETTAENGTSKLTIGGTSVSTDGSAAAGEIFALADTAAATVDYVADVAGKTARVNYKTDYNDLRTQISELAKDASFNGVNLLAGDDLSVVFNEDGSSKLDVAGVDIVETLGLSDLTDEDVLSNSKIDDVIKNLNTALNNLNAQASKFGSQLSVVETRQSFTKDMIGTLEDGALALVGADTNEEAANLATLQTRQALIVSALSISTQQESNVLQLLR